MRVVLQRVRHARVSIEGRVVGSIDRGFLLLVGLAQDDGLSEIAWMAQKIAGLRIFADSEGKMNLDLKSVEGRCLAVSQFTLLGDANFGRRPSFVQAMRPDLAAPLFDQFVEALSKLVGKVETGVFGADMLVELGNDGPVTMILERLPREE